MLAVYGATGYTGQLVARELARRDLDAVLCGRNGGKLRQLATELGVPFPLRAATIDDADGLRRAFSGVEAVINCAGPFTYYGAPVIEAALDAGAHYVDTTGEQIYMQRVFEHYDAVAEERGLAVVPAVGFDYVPGDLAAAIAARDLDGVEEVVIGYSVRGFGASRGTLKSGVEMAKESLEFEDGRWQRARGLAAGETFDFGAPIGEVPVFRYPGGEIVTAPRHVDTRAVRVRMNARGATPVGALAPLVPAALGVLGLAMRTPAGDVVESLIDQLPEGPAEDARRASDFVVVAEARAFDGTVGRARVEGSDVYGITAVMAVEAARLAAEGGASGALAPAELLEPEGFLDWLAPHGVRWSTEAPRPAPTKA